MLMYGSTLFFVQILSDVRAHRMLWTTAGIDQGSLTAAAGMSTAGSLLTWVQEVTGHASFDDLVAEAAQVPTGSDGLVMLPYLAGERTPVFDAQARGVLAGISLRHTRGHLFRAAYEGIAFGIRQIVDLFEALEAPQRIVAVGGGTQGGLWTQIVSDVTGREQLVPAQTIGASYGDALMAAIGTGLVAPETNWATDYEVVTPDPRQKARYDVLYDLYRHLYPATAPVIHELAAMQIADADLQGS
jgi:xylulokinase